jgi:protein associated with RNAse G/E
MQMLASVELFKMIPDGTQWGQWSGYHLPIDPHCTTVWTPAGTAMHWSYRTWEAQNHALAFVWPGRWYVIHAFYDPAGDFAGCYCDIVLPNPPVSPSATEIYYTDLYIDVVIRSDRSVFTKDEEVYARAMRVLPQLVELHDDAFRELATLAAHAQAWTGPFAAIGPHLARTDWATLDPSSATYLEARTQQWGATLE